MDERRGNDGAAVLRSASQSDDAGKVMEEEEDIGSASLLLSKVKEEGSGAQSQSSEF